MSGAPNAEDAREAAIPFVDQPEQAQSVRALAGAAEHVTGLRLRRELRAGSVTLRDFDFRRPRYALMARAELGRGKAT